MITKFIYQNETDLDQAIERAETFDAIYDAFVPGEQGHTAHVLLLHHPDRDPQPYTYNELGLLREKAAFIIFDI